MKFEIKNRWNASVLFSLETDSLKSCVEAAVKSRADLSGSDLSGSDLSRANGRKLTLVGKRPFLSIGPLGSRCANLLVFLTDAGVYVRAGCFWDTLEAFKAAVEATHGTNKHGEEYRAVIALIEAHARLWSAESPPPAESTEVSASDAPVKP